MRILQGYQFADQHGMNNQGDDDCPFDLPSYAIMDAAGVDAAAKLLAGSDVECLFQPIYKGTIEGPTFVTAEAVIASYKG